MSSTITKTKHNAPLFAQINALTPLLNSLRRDGYVHIPSLVPESSAQLDALRNAAAHITSIARKGKWPYIRTVPKQFPPWPSSPPDEGTGGIWGVQHLLHPEMPGRDVFAGVYFSEEICGIAEELLGVEQNDHGHANDDNDNGPDHEHLVMELFNLLVSPSGGPFADFELCWHRDDIRPDLSISEEARTLALKSPNGKQAHAQYNIALYDDASLVVVPGSHRRVRTIAEREADPYAADLPGSEVKVVQLKTGDAVFYDSNILHRGVYKAIDLGKGEVGRLTLHGSVGLAGHGRERARQVLQHGVGEWVDRDDARFDLEGKVGARAERMRKRLVEMGKGNDVGFSLEG